jgi:lysophospholipase L1-like esterase
MSKRRGRGINQAWGIGGVSVVAGAVLVLSGLALGQARSEAPANAGSVPQLPASTEQATAPQRLTVIGDSYTAGSGADSGEEARWPALVRTKLGIAVDNLAIGGVGYAQTNEKGENFVVESRDISPESTAIVFFGSRNDQSNPAGVRTASAEAFANALKAVPAEDILVIGPAWTDSMPPAFVTAARDSVKASADEAGLTFIDPLELGWIADTPDLIGDDAIHPTDAGQAYLAEKLSPLVEQLTAD